MENITVMNVQTKTNGVRFYTLAVANEDGVHTEIISEQLYNALVGEGLEVEDLVTEMDVLEADMTAWLNDRLIDWTYSDTTSGEVGWIIKAGVRDIHVMYLEDYGWECSTSHNGRYDRDAELEEYVANVRNPKTLKGVKGYIERFWFM